MSQNPRGFPLQTLARSSLVPRFVGTGGLRKRRLVPMQTALVPCLAALAIVFCPFVASAEHAGSPFASARSVAFLPPALFCPAVRGRAGWGSGVVMMAKKKDRKEGRVSYTGRKPKAQSEGLAHMHEKIAISDPAVASRPAPVKKRKLSSTQLRQLAALEQFEAQNSKEPAQEVERDSAKRGSAAAGHAAAQKERVLAEKKAKKERMEEAQRQYMLDQEKAEEEASDRLRSGASLKSVMSPRFRSSGGEEDEDEDDFGGEELSEAKQKQKARWYAGYFKKRDY